MAGVAEEGNDDTAYGTVGHVDVPRASIESRGECPIVMAMMIFAIFYKWEYSLSLAECGVCYPGKRTIGHHFRESRRRHNNEACYCNN
jgi:hypothetical protein